jgi:hypothetical protein
VSDSAPKLEDERPIAHHYVLVLVVEVLTLTTLFLLARAFR